MNRCARQNPFKCAQPLHREQEQEQAAPYVPRQGPRQRQARQETPLRAERTDISLFHADSVGSAEWRVKADFDQCSSQPVVSWPSVARNFLTLVRFWFELGGVMETHWEGSGLAEGM